MNTNANEEIKRKQAIQDRLDRIWEDQTELRILRDRLENELCDANLTDEESKWLKAQHWALGTAMDALVQQKNVINALMVNPHVFDEADTSDRTELITKLKDEETDLLDRLDKLSAFLLDGDKVAKINDDQLSLMRMQQETMANYRRILVARIFNLERDKGGHNND